MLALEAFDIDEGTGPQPIQLLHEVILQAAFVKLVPPKAQHPLLEEQALPIRETGGHHSTLLETARNRLRVNRIRFAHASPLQGSSCFFDDMWLDQIIFKLLRGEPFSKLGQNCAPKRLVIDAGRFMGEFDGCIPGQQRVDVGGEMREPNAIVVDLHRFAHGGKVCDPVGAVHVDILANVEGNQGDSGKWRGHGLFPFINMSEQLT
jgi:hypothetical protein